MATDDSPQETLQPSVPTGSDEDSRCQVCHDAFEQFYNEEKEEWHLRPAINYEGKNYHPLCLEDYKVCIFLFQSVRAFESSSIDMSIDIVTKLLHLFVAFLQKKIGKEPSGT